MPIHRIISISASHWLDFDTHLINLLRNGIAMSIRHIQKNVIVYQVAGFFAALDILRGEVCAQHHDENSSGEPAGSKDRPWNVVAEGKG